ncbi:hypothetical protein JYU34_015064 [Plutella xylostella]|uniref:Uncharacterized protein n=1 Tax=Plutella xylostella TaxID=51655 RepID=A0ABQ7Q768_PLUXY|nr:hypothetical protein JYU34_015064 [Plutella xylostella]
MRRHNGADPTKSQEVRSGAVDVPWKHQPAVTPTPSARKLLIADLGPNSHQFDSENVHDKKY